MPPLVAVVLAIGLRQVVLALFLAVWLGCSILAAGNPFVGLWDLLIGYFTPVLTDSFNLEILGFTFGLVGMVTVVGRMGGTWDWSISCLDLQSRRGVLSLSQPAWEPRSFSMTTPLPWWLEPLLVD